MGNLADLEREEGPVGVDEVMEATGKEDAEAEEVLFLEGDREEGEEPAEGEDEERGEAASWSGASVDRLWRCLEGE